MPELPLSQADGKPLVTDIHVKPRQRTERPPPCRRCQGRSWWNGWRVIFPVMAGALAGVAERWELPLPRAKCSQCKHGFTCYAPGVYPSRQYQLDVVAEAAAAVVLGERSAAQAARAINAGATSVRRWIGWLAELGRPKDLLTLAARLDADAPAGAGLPAPATAPTPRSRAAQVLVALEHLASALLRRGVWLAARTGLGQVLGWQYTSHGDVYGLVAGIRCLSPAMALGGAPVSQ